MPNHITNRLKIVGTKEQITKVYDFLGGKEIDFNNITPKPLWVYNKDLVISPTENSEAKYGEENCWYQWNLKNWGSKWGAYDIPDKRSTEDTIYFTTAWASAVDLMQKVGWMFPDVILEYSWADEDLGYNVCKVRFKDTEILDTNVPKPGSKEAYALAFEIMQSAPEDYDMRYDENTGNYEYIGE